MNRIKKGGEIVQNISKPFDLNKYIDEQIELGKKIIYMSGGGPVGLYCGIELMKTGKFIVIMSEQRKKYNRKQIFFLQYTNLFHSYDNLSFDVKNELEKMGCNIGTPQTTRSDNCNEYINRFDILNNLDGKLVSTNIFKFEELFFAEFILKGGIIIKPDSSLNISYDSNSLRTKNIEEKLIYALDSNTNKIVCIEGCKFYNNPNVEIDLNKVSFIIDSEGIGSKLRFSIQDNERTYLRYNDPSYSLIDQNKIIQVVEREKMQDDNILSYGLLLYLDTSKLSTELISKLNATDTDSFGNSLYDPHFADKTNNAFKKHYVAQHRYRFFASKINKYEQFYLNFNNLKSPDNYWYLSIMLSPSEYDYLKDILSLGKELEFEEIKKNHQNHKEHIELIDYLEILLFSCYNFYGLFGNDTMFIEELLNATTLFAFPVKMFYASGKIAGFLNSTEKPIFSIGDSILGVNYFSGTGVNYGMKYVDELINILNNNDSEQSKIDKYNKLAQDDNLLGSLSSSIERFINFDRINIKTIIENNFSFDILDIKPVSINRVYPSEKVPRDEITLDVFEELKKYDYGLNDIGKQFKFDTNENLSIDYLSNTLIDWMKKIFAFNTFDASYVRNSHNASYFNNLKKIFNDKGIKSSQYKVNLLLNGLAPYISSNLPRDLITNVLGNKINDEKIYYNNDLPELDLGIAKNDFVIFDNASKQSDEVSDPFQEHKNIITKYITNVFLFSNDSKYNTLSLIVNKFSEKISEYIQLKQLKPNSIKFVYKGGNVLKIIFETYKYLSSGIVSLLIDEYFSDNFKSSDMDFQILISHEYYDNPEIIKGIINDMTKMSYVLLNDIRIELFKSIDNYIDFFKYTPSVQKKYLESILNDLNGLYKNKENDPSNPNLTFVNVFFSEIYSNYRVYKDDTRPDTLITIDNESQSEPKLTKNGNIPNPFTKTLDTSNFYISVNNAIDKFNLVRMKINFYANYCKQNEQTQILGKHLAGEFIDVGISKEQKHTDFNKDIAKYTKKNNDGNILLEFESFTLKYFIKELYGIVFSYEVKEKSEKRLNRMLVLCLIDAYIKNNFVIDDNIKNYIATLIELVRDKYNKLFNDKSFNFQLVGGAIETPYDIRLNTYDNVYDKDFTEINKSFADNDKKIVLGNNNFDGFEYIIKEIIELEKPQEQENIEELVKIFNIIINTLKKFLEIFEKNNSSDLIYRITQLGGIKNADYKEKYLKYKMKYLQNKN